MHSFTAITSLTSDISVNFAYHLVRRDPRVVDDGSSHLSRSEDKIEDAEFKKLREGERSLPTLGACTHPHARVIEKKRSMPIIITKRESCYYY